MISSKYHLRKPALLLVTLASVLAPVASPRSAEASSLWDWLFPSRNHSYYAGPYGPNPHQAGHHQVGHHQYPVPQPSMNPVSANYGYSQATPAAGQPMLGYPPTAHNSASQTPPGQTYPQSQSYPGQADTNYRAFSGSPAYAGGPSTSGSPATQAPQQLTNPLVIIPASSAPIAGPATGPATGTPATGTSASSYPASSYPASGGFAGSSTANTAAGYAPSGYVSSGYAPSQATINGYVPGGVVSTGYAPMGTVTSSQVATTALMPGQTQQVFMTNQTSQFGNCASCLPGHARSSSYRTVWYRVPTTNVRPVAAVDPCTGLQSTVMRPCTTYSWQARRVPTMRSPSLCERLFSCFHRRRPPPTTLPMTANYLCGPTCGPVPTAGTAAPYYSPPATTSPSSGFPATGVSPWGGTSLPAEGYPGGSYPGGTYPGGGATGGGSPPLREPADERPSLDTRRYAPGNGDAYDPNGNSRGTNDRQGFEHQKLDHGADPDLDYDSAARRAPFTGRSPTLRGPQYSGPSEASPVRSSQEASEPRGREPQPVPDPDVLLQGPQRFEPPRLLNPKDRRASQAAQRAGDYVLASWPESPRANSQVSESAGSRAELAGNRVSEHRRPGDLQTSDSRNGDSRNSDFRRPTVDPVSMDARIPNRSPITPPRSRTSPSAEPHRGPATLNDGGWRTAPR